MQRTDARQSQAVTALPSRPSGRGVSENPADRSSKRIDGDAEGILGRVLGLRVR